MTLFNCLFYCLCTESGDVRLVGGASHCTGKLERKHQSEWRLVYRWGWNHQSSSVVCRQLDCGSAVSTQRISGSTVQPVWNIPSSCVRSQPSMRECEAKSSHNSTETLEVVCSGKTMTPTMTIICTVHPFVCVCVCVCVCVYIFYL